MEKFSLCAQLVTENLSCIISEFGRGFQSRRPHVLASMRVTLLPKVISGTHKFSK